MGIYSIAAISLLSVIATIVVMLLTQGYRNAVIAKGANEYLAQERKRWYSLGHSSAVNAISIRMQQIGISMSRDLTRDEYISLSDRLDNLLKGRSFTDLTMDEHVELLTITSQMEFYEGIHEKLPLE